MVHPSPKLMDLGPKGGLCEMKASHFRGVLISDAIKRLFYFCACGGFQIKVSSNLKVVPNKF